MLLLVLSLAGNVLTTFTRFIPCRDKPFYSLLPCREIFYDDFTWYSLAGKNVLKSFPCYIPCRDRPMKFTLYPLVGKMRFKTPLIVLPPWRDYVEYLVISSCSCDFVVPLKYSLNAGWPGCVLYSLWERKTLTLSCAIKLCLTVNMRLCFVVVLCPSGNIGGWVWLSKRV